MLRFFEKKAFGGCKSQIFVIGYRFAGPETELGTHSSSSFHFTHKYEKIKFNWLAATHSKFKTLLLFSTALCCVHFTLVSHIEYVY